MEILIYSVKFIHIIVSVLLVIVVLLQPGKGGDLGSIFGGGTTESVFGASGAVPFLGKVTRVLAILFLLSSLALGYFATQDLSSSVITDTVPSAVEPVPEDSATTGNELDLGLPDTETNGASAPESAEKDSQGEATKNEGEGTEKQAPAE